MIEHVLSDTGFAGGPVRVSRVDLTVADTLALVPR